MSSPRHRQADVVLRDGTRVHVRPVRATDAPAVRAFFEHLSPTSITLRFFSSFPDLDRAVRWATDVDQHRYGLIATGADNRVVAHAGWETDPDRPQRAEVAFAIAEAMQHNGLGTILLGQLIEAADQAGVAVLSAEVLPQNHHMLHVFRDSGFPLTTRTLPGVILVELATSRPPTPLERFESRSRIPSHSCVHRSVGHLASSSGAFDSRSDVRQAMAFAQCSATKFRTASLNLSGCW